MTIRYDGKVAIVTGSGGGLGRCHAGMALRRESTPSRAISCQTGQTGQNRSERGRTGQAEQTAQTGQKRSDRVREITCQTVRQGTDQPRQTVRSDRAADHRSQPARQMTAGSRTRSVLRVYGGCQQKSPLAVLVVVVVVTFPVQL